MTEQEKLLEDARKRFAPIFAHPDDIERAAQAEVESLINHKDTKGTKEES